MSLIDQKGRLWGRINVIDLGAVVIIMAALIGIFLLPGKQAGGVVQIGPGETLGVEVDMIARGVSGRSLEPFQQPKADLIIRNQPYGQVEVVQVEDVTREIPLVFPDGEVRAFPTPDAYRLDLVFTLRGEGRTTEDGIILGNNKVKIGVPLEIETFDYNIRGTVMDVRVLS